MVCKPSEKNPKLIEPLKYKYSSKYISLFLSQPAPVGLRSFHLKQEGQSARLLLSLVALTTDLIQGVDLSR